MFVISISFIDSRPHSSGKARTLRTSGGGTVTIQSLGTDASCLCFFSATSSLQSGIARDMYVVDR